MSRPASQDPLEQAAFWFATLQDEAVSDAERHRWQQWLQASSANQQAWMRVEQLDQQFRGVPAQPARRALQAAGRSRRRMLGSLAGLAIAGPLAWWGWRSANVASADIRTAVGEVRSLQLPDGTQLWLNTDSAVQLHFDTRVRRISLLAGEIAIQTVPDVRPLQVHTSQGLAVPLGTQFSVRLLDRRVRIAVTQGRVDAQPRLGQNRIVPAGQSLHFDTHHCSTLMPIAGHEHAWQQQLLVADDLPLGEFLDQLARYRAGWIRYDDDVAALRLVGSFPLNDTDTILTALEESLPVKVHRLTPWWVKVEKR